MSIEDNIQGELKRSESKVESCLRNETVLKNPSADFSVVNLDNSNPQDDTMVSKLFVNWIYITKTEQPSGCSSGK